MAEQKRYIITEECRNKILDHLQAMKLPNANLLRKWIIEGSRPYQNQREKILDELEEWNNTFNLQLLSEKIKELRGEQ